MLRVVSILGHLDDPCFAGRAVDGVPVTWAEASKRRLRRVSQAGADIAIDLPRGTYLADGAVLHDDGEHVIVVVRTLTPTLVLSLPRDASRGSLIRAAVLIGQAFGNQHVPVDVEGEIIRVPLTTSETVARATVAALDISGLAVLVEEVALARAAPVGSSGHHEHDDRSPEGHDHQDDGHDDR